MTIAVAAVTFWVGASVAVSLHTIGRHARNVIRLFAVALIHDREQGWYQLL
jgi:hypothetical protein